MLLGVTAPFVLLTDLYPFYRFGMFAEPVRRTIQTEQFLLRYVDASGRLHGVEPPDVGLSGLAYLMRNYYYRGHAGRFLRHIHRVYPRKDQVAEWQLLRIILPAHTNRPDTTLVGQWQPGQES